MKKRKEQQTGLQAVECSALFPEIRGAVHVHTQPPTSIPTPHTTWSLLLHEAFNLQQRARAVPGGKPRKSSAQPFDLWEAAQRWRRQIPILAKNWLAFSQR